MNIKMLSMIFVASALATTSLGSVVGPNYEEDDGNDAGSTVNTSKKLNGSGQLLLLSGSLSGDSRGQGDYQDVYQILISDVEAFKLNFLGTEGDFDTMLWLFDEEGRALLGNNDSLIDGQPSPLSFLRNESTDGSFQLQNPGKYYIAISGFNSQPVSELGSMFDLGADPFGVFAANGQGANATQNGWTQNGATGNYLLSLEGVSFIPVPAPGALALLGLAGIMGCRRRR
ncbi:MAG: DVUA0089 family protein [Phycisphaerales bacterium]|nr:DVUA0089 family protein [Phycisphaerales bacterium]